MKKLLLAALSCFLYFLSFAQGTQQSIIIKGIVIDSAVNKPLGYVTVALTDAGTSAPVKSMLTRDDGVFEMVKLPARAYQLSLIYVGYKTKIINISGKDAVKDIGRVVLSPSSNQLKEVSVTVSRPLMKREVDRISYDVQADPESKALSALDMMRKVPLLAVDASDNIKLKGSGNYKILINGKESALVAKNPSDVLKAMPATNIEKIEVITTPPAKYDAEGLAGIINIITKKNADQGYNIGINGRYNSVYGPGINLNGTVKQGKFGLAAYGGFGSQKRQTTTSANSQTFFRDQSTIEQFGTNIFDGGYKYGNAELSYEIDSLNLLTGSVEIYDNKFDQNSSQVSNTLSSNGIITQHYNLLNNSTGTYTGMDAAINYQLGFRKSKDRLLTVSYKYSYSPNKQFDDNIFTERLNYPLSGFPDFQQYNNAGNKEHTFQLDYVHPLKKLTAEAGGKAILRNNYSDFERGDRDILTGQYLVNPAQTNTFNYHQDVYSLYNSYQLKLSKWTAKGGLRIEYTTIDADFTSVGSAINRDYSNVIPSLSVQRSFKTSSVNVGFTQRIQRPGIYQLNPFVNRSNPKFINTGNPDLRPELNNTFELTYSNFAKSSFNLGLSYAFSNNSIQNVTSLKADTINGRMDTVTTTTYQNLGSNRTLGLNFNTTFNFTKKLSLSLNGQVSQIWLRGTYNGQFYKNKGLIGNAFGNAGYKFNAGYRFGIDAGFFSGDVNLQGKSRSFIFSSYVLSKEMFSKKATISLVANNPYTKFRSYTSTTTTPDFYQMYNYQNYYRTLAVRFNYKFGRLNSEIKKNQRGISNDDTKSGGSKSSGN